MGYTHYWRRPQEIPVETFIRWTDDVRQIIRHANVPVCFEYNHPDMLPEINCDIVRFNGVRDNGHETFFIERSYIPNEWQKPDENGLYFEFCKTALKPYDLVVTAALIRLARHCAKGIEITSDGGRSEWEAGRQLCEKIFGFAALPFHVTTVAT